MKISIIGNSVAMRVRPPLDYPENNNFSQCLEEIFREKWDKNIHIQNLSLGALTIKEAISRMDEYIRTFPDYYILNLGVVDASTRDIPHWVFRIFYGPKDGLLPGVLRKLYYNPVSKRIRPFFVHLRGKRSWISANKYNKLFHLLVDTLIKETNAKIIVLPINIANDRIEKQLPGSRLNHKKFNVIMNEACKRVRVHYLNIEKWNTDEYYPDGIHFSGKGHKIIAEKIFEAIKT